MAMYDFFTNPAQEDGPQSATLEGLLGNWGKWTGDPDRDAAIQQGLLSTGLGMMAGKGSTRNIIGQAGLQGMNQFGQTMQAAKQRRLQELHAKTLQQQLTDQQSASQRQRTLESLPARNMRKASWQDDRDVGQPGEQRPTLDMEGLENDMLATPGGFEQGMALRQARQPKPDDFKVVDGSLVRIGRDGKIDEAYRAPQKPESSPSAVREYQFAVGQGYKGSFEQWDTSRKRAGASNVNVGGGKPPAGYLWGPDGTTLVSIPGGPADKLPEKQQNQVVGVQNLQKAIAEYRADLATFGVFDAVKPDARARMGTKYNNMMLQAKEAYNLGVLNGPDLEILQSVITDPRSFTGAITSRKALDEQAQELSRIMGSIGAVSSNVRPRVSDVPSAPSGKTVVRTGTLNGRKVIQYSDGSTDYAD